MAAKKITLCPMCKKREKYIPPSGGKVGYCKICMNIKKKSPAKSKTIHCPRGVGSEVERAACEENQGCNDACFTCEHFKEDKTLNAMTMEEQREAKYTHQSVMAADYSYDEI